MPIPPRRLRKSWLVVSGVYSGLSGTLLPAALFALVGCQGEPLPETETPAAQTPVMTPTSPLEPTPAQTPEASLTPAAVSPSPTTTPANTAGPTFEPTRSPGATATPGDGESPTPLPTPEPLPRVVLNEVNCQGDDWIELYNAGNAPADLTGLALTDAPEDPSHRFTFRRAPCSRPPLFWS